MITTRHHMTSLTARLIRRAAAIAARRARETAAQERSGAWHDARALWPDFTQD